MSVVIKWSVILALLVTVLSIVITVTGLHRNPLAGGVGFIGLAMVLNVVVLVLALRQTAGDNAYGRQFINSVLIGAVAGVLIYLSSWALLSVVFPDSLDQMRAGYTEWLQASGLPEEQLQQQIEQIEGATPASQSVAGFMGTFFTSLIAGAIISIFVRKK